MINECTDKENMIKINYQKACVIFTLTKILAPLIGIIKWRLKIIHNRFIM